MKHVISIIFYPFLSISFPFLSKVASYLLSAVVFAASSAFQKAAEAEELGIVDWVPGGFKTLNKSN